MANPKNKNQVNPGNESKFDDTGKSSISMEGLNTIIDNTSKIVLKAANILEEEIAKGIIAAKQVEGKLTDVSKLHSNNQDELLTRFRKDAHDIIDLLVDFTTIALKNVRNVSSQFISIKQESGGTTVSQTESSQQIPLIKVPKELIPGEIYEMPITLENDNGKESKSIQFENSAFSGPADYQMPVDAISFIPNPLLLPPGDKGIVTVKVAVPAEAREGSYSCLVQAKNMTNLKATLFLRIVKS